MFIIFIVLGKGIKVGCKEEMGVIMVILSIFKLMECFSEWILRNYKMVIEIGSENSLNLKVWVVFVNLLEENLSII